MKMMVVMLAGGILLISSAVTVCAQDPVPPPEAAGPTLAPGQVDQLVGPIALYPDPLIAEILPAATFPSEIVMANRYVSQNGDPNQIAEQGWDPSVQALCHYPNILKWMDDNLAWTTQLGQAFQNQQADVMDSVQRLRGQAQSLGNLPSTPQEAVTEDDGDIEIEPTDPDQMYVPTYPLDTIYEDPGVYCTFPFALPLGVWLGYDWDWHHHGVVRWGPGHPRPGNWWHQTPVERHTYLAGHPRAVWDDGGTRAVGARGGWHRGFATPTERGRAPIVVNVPPAPLARQSEPIVVRQSTPTYRPPVAAPVERAPVIRSAPSTGFFVGGQSGHEAVESSSRGAASRGVPAGGGGGGGAHAGGGGGGGGHGGGGGGHH